MSLSQFLKYALSTLRNQEGRWIMFSAPAPSRAPPQVFHHHTRNKLGNQRRRRGRHPYNQSFTDPSSSSSSSSYHTQSVLLIMFPLLASTSMLILLARDKYMNQFSRIDWSQEYPKKDFMTKPISEWTDNDKSEYFIARYKRFGTSRL